MRAATIDVNRMAELLLTTQAKGLVLLLAVGVGVLMLRRGAAATRHWLWFLGMGGLLMLPVLGAVLPRWSIEMPAWVGARLPGADVVQPWPALAAAASGATESAATASVATRSRVAASGASASGAARSGAKASIATVVTAAPRPRAGQSSIAEEALAPRARVRPAAPVPVPARDVPSQSAASTVSATSELPALRWTAGLLIGIWALGCTLLLVSLAASLLAVRRLSVTSSDFPRGRVTELTEQMRLGMGIGRRVRVLRGDPGAMPMSWGLLRPVILLPEGAERWHNARLVSVLLHELSHVRRHDCFSQFVAEVALALHWPNPLAWLAARRLRVEREHACDDAVVAAGARPSEYAEELLSLARGFHTAPRTSTAAVAMARPVHLAARVRSLVRERTARRLTLETALALAGVALGFSAGVASLSPTTAQASNPSRAVLPKPAPASLPHTPPPAPTRDEVIPARLAALISFDQASQEATCGMAPSGWERNTVNSDDDSHRLSWSRPGCGVEVRVEGDVEFTPDFRDVASLGRDAFIRIEEEDGRTERRLDVTAGSGGTPTYQYRVDGSEQPFDAAARAWYEGMLLQVFRRAGFMAEERVGAMLRAGGVGAVLQELDAIPSDFVFATYVRELFEQADPSAVETGELLARAGSRVDSDYYMAEILGAVADRHLGSDQVLDTFIAATRTIESDHYRSEVLGRALRLDDLTPVRVAAVLGSASEISSDHYLSELLESIAARYALEPELREVYLGAVESIESDHYRAQVLSTLLARNDLQAAELAVVLQAASGVGSDHYRTEILQRVAGRALPSDPLRAAYLQAASGIESDHYRSQALGYLLERETLSAAQLQELIGAASGIESDHYKADLLIHVLRRHRMEGETRQAFMDAMDTIGSSHYRGEVAQALLRSDRGGV
jgi:beta-lactamase regulating signal transducer with metallopeptidase domain